MAHVDVTSDNFERDVIQRSHEHPVVVDFWADWCGPCRVLGPVLERLADRADGRWTLAKIDTMAAPDLAQAYGIQGIPAVKAFRDGTVIDEFVGALPEPAVESWLRGFVPDLADELCHEGDLARASGDEAGARAKYHAALEVRRDHAASLLALAELGPAGEVPELLARLPARLEPDEASRKAALGFALEATGADAATLRAAVAASPDDLDARWQLAHRLAAEGDAAGALEHLLELVRRDRSYRDDGARKAMLAVFDMVGARSELSETWRKKLASVLF